MELNPAVMASIIGVESIDRSAESFPCIVDNLFRVIVGPADVVGKWMRQNRFGEVLLADSDGEGNTSSVDSAVKRLSIRTDRGSIGGGMSLIVVGPKTGYVTGKEALTFMVLIAVLVPAVALMAYRLIQASRKSGLLCRQLEEGRARLEEQLAQGTAALEFACEEARRHEAQRQQAEVALNVTQQRYEDLVQHATDIIFASDAQGRFTFVNPVALRITELSQDEVIGHHFTEFVHPEYSDRSREFYERQARDGKTETYYEFPMITKSGETVWLGQKTLLMTEGSERIGFQSIAWDISARRQVEVQLLEAKEAAEAGNKAKTEFLARMSHEIRTPINAIVGYTELLLDDELSEEQREALETVKLSSNALLALIDDILDLSKVDAGKIDLDEIPFHVESLLVDACELVRGKIGNKSIEILCDLQDIPEYLNGDPARIRQVLVNLLGNAVKFTDQGEILASARVLERTGQKIHVEVTVQDTGIGIPVNMHEAIFDPFTQAHTSVAYEHGGTGLGLAICRRLVRLMGGDVSVSSHPGDGSLFSFHVWLSEPELQSVGVPKPLPVHDLAGKRALLIDDSATALRILKSTLERVGIESICASSAAEAFQHLDTTCFDFAIVDIRMPEINGYQFASQVCAACSDRCPKLIALSSEPQWRDKSRLAEAGFDGFLMKPTRRQVLYSMIGTVLALSGKADSPMTRHALRIPHSRAPRVLLAEDNPINQRMALRMLAKMGIEADVAENGFKAVEKARAQAYDLILMDVQMPVMGGLEATRELRRACVEAPIVAMTASAMKGDKEQCLDAGMTDYVSKPIKHQTMHEILTKFCGIEGVIDSPERLRILVANPDHAACKRITGYLGSFLPSATIAMAKNGVEASARLGSLLPHMVIFSLATPKLDVTDLVTLIRSDKRYRSTRLLATISLQDSEIKIKEIRELGIVQISSDRVETSELKEAIEQLFSNAGTVSKKRPDRDEAFVERSAEALGVLPAEYLDLAAEFVGDVTHRLQALERALDENDSDRVRQVAHAVKGGASEMLLEDMAAAAARIEGGAEKGDLSKCGEDLVMLRTALERFRWDAWGGQKDPIPGWTPHLIEPLRELSDGDK